MRIVLLVALLGTQLQLAARAEPGAQDAMATCNGLKAFLRCNISVRDSAIRSDEGGFRAGKGQRLPVHALVETPPARTLRVLLVDDNRDAADTCATLLELAGHEVRTAYSGRRALELVEEFRPQDAVLDIGLPDLDGYQVAQLIRGASWGKDTQLVAVTGWGRDEDRKRAFAAGFDHHLTKPITGDALNSLLCTLPNSYRTADALASVGEQSQP